DATTGQMIVSGALLSSKSLYSKVLYLGGQIVFFIANLTDGKLQYYTLSPSNPTGALTGPMTIASDLNLTTPVFSVNYNSNQNRACIAYYNNGGFLSIYFLSSSFVLSSSITLLSAVFIYAVDITSDANGNFWISFYTTSNIHIALIANSGGNPQEIFIKTVDTDSSNTVQKLTGIVVSGVITLFFEKIPNSGIPSGIPNDFFRFISSVTMDSVGNLGTNQVLIRSVGLASQAFISNNNIYVLASYGMSAISSTNVEPFQATYFLINSAGTPLARISAPNGGPTGVGGGNILNPVLPQVYQNQFPILQQSGPWGSGGANFSTALALSQINFSSPIPEMKNQIANNLIVSGGMISQYDGNSITEQNFHLFPEFASILAHNSGGQVDDGTHLYAIVYQWE